MERILDGEGQEERREQDEVREEGGGKTGIGAGEE